MATIPFVIPSEITSNNTSGTYNFAPSLGEVVLNAYSRLKIRGPMITAEHMANATMEANLMQAQWNNKGPNLWAVDLRTILTIPGVATYAVPGETVMILDSYLSQGASTALMTAAISATTLTVTAFASGQNNLQVGSVISDQLGLVKPGTMITALGSGSGGLGTYTVSISQTVASEQMFAVYQEPQATNNRYLTPVSRTEYASYPNPTQQSPPTTYWFDRLIAPTITFYPTPDQVYPLSYYRYRNAQDALIGGGVQMEIPAIWLDAACAGLAHRLCRHYGTPQLEQLRKMDAMEAYQIAADQNVENSTFYIAPMIAGYYQ